MDESDDISTIAGRLATFERPHHMNKRRASQNSKKKGQTSITWPHKTPAPEQLARAGFYFRPSSSSQDSVSCFLCNKALDGWDSGDNPALEHLSHVPHCGWAINICIEQRSQDMDRVEEDPLSDKMIEARRATFRDQWPHERKKGWKCKLAKMVEAGWCYNPLPEADDCVQCFYCGVSLDGWEPKDDPWEEHQRRAPDCHFFTLIEESAKSNARKSKASREKSRGNPTRASKASRISTQSNLSVTSDGPSYNFDDDNSPAEDDDTILTNASTVSKAGAKGKKKPAAKNSRAGRKKTSTVAESITQDAGPDIIEPDKTRSTRNQTEPVAEESFAQERDATQLKAKKPRATRGKKASAVKAVDAAQELEQNEDMLLDETAASVPPAAKQTKARSKKQPTSKIDQKPADIDQSTAGAEPEEPPAPTRKVSRAKPTKKKQQTNPDESLAEEVPKPKPKRGKKRTSEGIEKPDESILVVSENAPVSEPAITKPAPPKRGRAASRVIKKPAEPEQVFAPAEHEKQVKVTTTEEQLPTQLPEKALKRISRNKSNTITKGGVSGKERVRQGSEAEDAARPPTPPPEEEPALTSPASSPQSSDAENHPPSSRPSLNVAVDEKGEGSASAPLKPSTPTCSPSKRNVIAGGLTSVQPWTTIDLETIFLPSPSSRHNQNGEDKENVNVEVVIQNLTSPEKKMSVEQWIMWNAGRAEDKLKTECERLIGIFEGEGVKALQALEGIDCA